MLEAGVESDKYFLDGCGTVFEQVEEPPDSVSILTPGRTSLRTVLGCDDAGFLDFLTCLLQIDPAKRVTAAEALAHPWMRPEAALPFEPYVVG